MCDRTVGKISSCGTLETEMLHAPQHQDVAVSRKGLLHKLSTDNMTLSLSRDSEHTTVFAFK